MKFTQFGVYRPKLTNIFIILANQRHVVNAVMIFLSTSGKWFDRRCWEVLWRNLQSCPAEGSEGSEASSNREHDFSQHGHALSLCYLSTPQVSMVVDIVMKRTRWVSEEAGQSFIDGFRLSKAKSHMQNGLDDDLSERHPTVPQMGEVGRDTCGLIADSSVHRA